MSVHRVRIAALSRLPVDEEVRGRLLGNRIYAQMSALAGNRRVGALIGRTVRTRLIHDGVAAALDAGAQKTAAVMVGRSLATPSGATRERARRSGLRSPHSIRL